jgi:hypothetical protein
MRTQDYRNSLPLPLAGRHIRRSALLLSTLLHAALLTAIVVLRDSVPPLPDQTTSLRIAVIPGLASEEPIDSLVGDDASADTGVEVPETAALEEAAAATSGAEPPPPDEQRLGEIRGEAEIDISGALPTETPKEPIDEPPLEQGVVAGTVPVEAPVPDEPAPTADATPRNSEQEAVAATEGAGEVVVTESARARRTEALSQTESELLTRRVDRWARSFAALADWQPETTWEDRGQEYSATVERVPSTSSTGVEHAIVTIKTERDGESLSTTLRMQRLGFSHFAQFIDQWDPDVQIHDDVIDGRFHSNTEIFISRSGGVQPQFTGLVTAPRGVNTSRSQQRVRRNEVFSGGLDTGAGRITLPRKFALFDNKETADDETLTRFETDTRIVFAADGSYRWNAIETSRRRSRNSPDETLPSGEGRIGTQPHYFVGAEDAALHVRGTVNGQVLVYSPEGIVIEDDLRYAANPLTDPNSDDYLGLVSDRSIEIAEMSVTGPGDLHVQAAIYARRRFAVRNYGRSDDATLFVYGSVTAGSLTATEPRFSTELRFDKRLEAARPPQFPVTDRYEVEDWDGNWVFAED